MSQPNFSLAAVKDLREILEFVARDNPKAAVAIVDKLEEVCNRLAENPHMGSPREDLRTRLRCFTSGSHVIYFRPTDHGIDVLRVLHGSRDATAIFR